MGMTAKRIVTTAVVAVVACAALACEIEDTGEPTDNKIATACRVAEQVIRDNLKSPASADFAGNCWRADGQGRSGYVVTRMRDNEHRWKIEVDAMNSFGALIRTVCIAETRIGTTSAYGTFVSCSSR